MLALRAHRSNDEEIALDQADRQHNMVVDLKRHLRQ